MSVFSSSMLLHLPSLVRLT